LVELEEKGRKALQKTTLDSDIWEVSGEETMNERKEIERGDFGRLNSIGRLREVANGGGGKELMEWAFVCQE